VAGLGITAANFASHVTNILASGGNTVITIDGHHLTLLGVGVGANVITQSDFHLA
jgi:hypothetical protein